jgi:hypothetical protein
MNRSYNRVLEWSILLPVMGFAVSFLYIAIASMPFPFLLEWMEGQSIDVVQRILEGKPLYGAPTLEYVPLIYPPYYFYVTAFVTLITGGDFLPARLVSTLATLGVCAVIYYWLRRENAGWRLALTGACLFLATYRLSGRWFDMSRVDSLFLFLTFAGLYVAVYWRGLGNAVLAAAILTMAFFTKQSALMAALPVLAALAFTNWRHALAVAAALTLLCNAGVWLMDYESGGWFSFYAFTVPAGHGFDRGMYLGFWKRDIFGRVGIFFLMALAVIAYQLRSDWRKGLLYCGMAAGFIGASYVSRIHSYGYINVLMPMHAFLALMTGLALSSCRRADKSQVALTLAGMVVLIELATLLYNPGRQIPGPELTEAGNRFIEQLASREGDIFMPEIQYIQTRADKQSYAFGMAAFDVLRANLGKKEHVKHDLNNLLATAIREKRFAGIIPGNMLQLPGLKQYYVKLRHIDYPQRYVTGALGSLPTDLYVPKP